MNIIGDPRSLLIPKTDQAQEGEALGSRLATKQESSQGSRPRHNGRELEVEAKMGTGRSHGKKGGLWQAHLSL